MSHRAATALARTLRGMSASARAGWRPLHAGRGHDRRAHRQPRPHRQHRRPGGADASTYRRLQRFFQHVDLGSDWAAPILARLIGATGAWTLALEPTNWRIGTRDVNDLVLAVVTRRFRVPLF